VSKTNLSSTWWQKIIEFRIKTEISSSHSGSIAAGIIGSLAENISGFLTMKSKVYNQRRDVDV
jgi:hypothetical protein